MEKRVSKPLVRQKYHHRPHCHEYIDLGFARHVSFPLRKRVWTIHYRWLAVEYGDHNTPSTHSSHFDIEQHKIVRLKVSEPEIKRIEIDAIMVD